MATTVDKTILGSHIEGARCCVMSLYRYVIYVNNIEALLTCPLPIKIQYYWQACWQNACQRQHYTILEQYCLCHKHVSANREMGGGGGKIRICSVYIVPPEIKSTQTYTSTCSHSLFVLKRKRIHINSVKTFLLTWFLSWGVLQKKKNNTMSEVYIHLNKGRIKPSYLIDCIYH